MNSKELLEKARDNMKKHVELINRIEDAERIMEWLENHQLELYVSGSYINAVIRPETVDKIKGNAMDAIKEFSSIKQKELEQLLGIQSVPVIPPLEKAEVSFGIAGQGRSAISILPPDTPEVVFPGDRKPATINPEFEAAVQEMVQQHKPEKVKAAAESLIKPIEDDKSLDKYPAKKKSTFPDGMTEEVVRKMYIDQNMPQKAIAEHFGVKLSKVNTFIQKHNLFRGSYKKEGKSEPNKEHP